MCHVDFCRFLCDPGYSVQERSIPRRKEKKLLYIRDNRQCLARTSPMTVHPAAAAVIHDPLQRLSAFTFVSSVG